MLHLVLPISILLITGILGIKGEIMAQRGRVYSLVAEHDYMHAETLFYMYLNLENKFKVRPDDSVVNYVLGKV